MHACHARRSHLQPEAAQVIVESIAASLYPVPCLARPKRGERERVGMQRRRTLRRLLKLRGHVVRVRVRLVKLRGHVVPIDIPRVDARR